jgi:tRNA G18 (ribose-2'-O)-methylase SpoU
MLDLPIHSLADPRLEPFRDLKSPASRTRPTFIAEGEKLVLRLLDSLCRTESILCTTAARDRLRDRLPDDIPIYIAGTPVISALIGFQFHRGILACGRRPAEKSLSELCGGLAHANRCLLVLCPEIRDPANLGTIIRTAAAFGASGVVAGRAGTDPFSRRVLRTSMGSVLKLPIVQTDDWNAALTTLHRCGFESIATVLDPDAAALRTSTCPPRAAIFLGNEDEGLPADLVAGCQRRVTLPMAAGVDSLNVAVAAGIVLSHFANLPPRLDSL